MRSFPFLLALALVTILSLAQLVCASISYADTNGSATLFPARTIPDFATENWAREGYPVDLAFDKLALPLDCIFNASSLSYFGPSPLSSLTDRESFIFVNFIKAWNNGCLTYPHILRGIARIYPQLRAQGMPPSRTIIVYVNDDQFQAQDRENPMADPFLTSSSFSIPDGPTPGMDYLITASSSHDALQALLARSSLPNPTITLYTDRGVIDSAFSNPLLRLFSISLALIVITTALHATRKLIIALRNNTLHIDTRTLVHLLSLLSAIFTGPALLVRWCSHAYFILALASDLATSASLSLLLLLWLRFATTTYHKPWIIRTRFLLYACFLLNLSSIILNYIIISSNMAQRTAILSLTMGGIASFIPAILVSATFLLFSLLFFSRRRTHGTSQRASRALLKLAILGLIAPLSHIPMLVDFISPILSPNTPPSFAIVLFTLSSISMTLRTVYIIISLGVVSELSRTPPPSTQGYRTKTSYESNGAPPQSIYRRTGSV